MTAIPKLTAAEAAVLRRNSLDPSDCSAAEDRLKEIGLLNRLWRGGNAAAIEALAAYDAQQRAEILANFHRHRPSSEWHEDDGPALWFTLPIEEPPYCGTPNDGDWPWMPTEMENLSWCRLPVIFFSDAAIRALIAKEMS